MKTTEKIFDKEIEIEWDFVEITEMHDSNWCEWFVKGYDSNGNVYHGSCQADGSNPNDSYDIVTDIEVIGK